MLASPADRFPARITDRFPARLTPSLAPFETRSDRSTPLVIDFFATWCGPCVLLASELEKVKAELGDAVRIVKVDTDEEADLSTQLQIQGLPTLVFVGTDTEKPALRTEGMLPAEMGQVHHRQRALETQKRGRLFDAGRRRDKINLYF